MPTAKDIHRLDSDMIGQDIYDLIKELFPICRSITGDGVRQTLKILSKHIPLEIHEVPTGTKVFDWTVPKEWNIMDAYIKDKDGKRVVDFQENNLHVMSYSIPVRKTMGLNALKNHLFTIPDHPNWIPYKTSYYKEAWGFCLRHNDLLSMKDGPYEAYIDASLEPGHLTLGDCFIRGSSKDEVVVSTHTCHPSLCNDNLSGIAVAVFLAKYLLDKDLRYSYRFLFNPGTIGAIAWLALNEERAADIKHGLVLTGLGDSGKITYKKSRQGNAVIDRAAEHVLKRLGNGYSIRDFSPYGYDERQYCSPGFNLPVGRLSRTPYGEYAEYHTSADNLEFVKAEALAESFRDLLKLIEVLEKNETYVNLYPMCEPQLGKRGLYQSIGKNELAMLWVLNLSDGNNSLLDIAKRASLSLDAVSCAANTLFQHGLLKHENEQANQRSSDQSTKQARNGILGK